MGKFAKASTQAASVMKELQGSVIKSVGTVRDYESSLRVAAQWAKDNRITGGLRGMSVADCTRFLQERGKEVGQKTVDQNRQALQCMLQHVTGKLAPDGRLPMAEGRPQDLGPRAYTPEQVRLIAEAQTPRNGLATEIAYAAGLRASELITLQPLAPSSKQQLSDRPASPDKFSGRSEGVPYSVHGKGGLIREVRIPQELAAKLEAYRLPEPKTVSDRGVFRETHYAIGGGNAWSASFSRASEKLFGWSTGAHGLRHSYAQERMQELTSRGFSADDARQVVSQELGHFRPDITYAYLR